MTSKSQLNYDPKATPLTDEELKNAKSELINTFRKVTRHKIDPAIPRQNILNISFMLLEKPHNGVVGFFKPRGAFNDEEEATNSAESIIKNVDSCFIIHEAHMGHWNPITNNKEYSQDLLDVKTKEDEILLRDRAIKEEAKKNQQLQRELQERKEEFKNLATNEEDPSSLDYYTKKRVTEKELKAYIIQGEDKLKKLRKSLRKISKEIEEKQKLHPEYEKQWLDNYNKFRAAAGVDPLTEDDLLKPNILGQMDVDQFEK